MHEIFVSVASYKDLELQFTVNNLLEKARNPNDIIVVVAQQDDPQNFVKFNQPNVKTLNFHYVDSQGVCWARKQINDCYNGEKIFLQIDSHIAMTDNWDDVIKQQIELVKNRGSEKVVFATYPTGYRIEAGIRKFNNPYIPRTVLRDDDIFEFQAGTGGPNDFNEPIPTPYLNAGCMFGDGSFYRDCPYDSDIYFEGEELLNTVKAFTHGYDLFNPSEHICWHLYKLWDDPRRDLWNLHYKEADDSQRSIRHWERNRKSKKKLVEIFTGKMPDELGIVRTISDYESYIKRPILKEKQR